MKKLFYICLPLLIFGCASKQPVPTLAKETSGQNCTLTNSTNCKPVNTAEAAPVEIAPFYENVSPSTMPDSANKNTPLNSELAVADGQKQKDDVDFDIPMVMNEDVERWITYFQTSGRKFFASWLSRSGKYIPMMQAILKQHGMPQDLVYLSMIESGFKPYAYSHAKASGCWQFIKKTGSRYGLISNWWIDERRDPEKSTLAATQHLKDLYDQFNHWYLAAAGYNAGAGKITRAMQRYSTDDFWEMTQFRYLKPETKNYVPKMIAAAMIAKQPENYGFTGIVYEEPLQYAKVHVPESVELSAVAKSLEVDVSLLEDLNPELLRGITPPNYPDYELKIPVGMEKKFLDSYAEIREKSSATVVHHVVKRSENLGSIARNYGTTSQAIMSMNNLKSSRVKPGMELAIPLKKTKGSRANMPEASLHKYEVQNGDSLWTISKRYNVSVSELKAWNKLGNNPEIQPGKKINIRPRSEGTMMVSSETNSGRTSPWVKYRVKKGDTLWGIAKKHNVEVGHLKNWNNLTAQRSSLYPGKSLRIKAD